ncbi:MAG TPA: hypothetical protein VMN37_04410 [Gemmatimonadales bacterium]|nr:hypothetical protein [Gemmatimonadales bacterium]
MTRYIATAAEAVAELEYFNGFHDGFIRELVLRSDDRFEARGVHTMSGRLDLDLLLAHYNYRAGEPPADQLIRARFRQVRDLVMDVPHRHGEWSIDRIRIDSGVRPGWSGDEPCLVARVFHHRLVSGAWTTAEGIGFTFLEADLEELCGGAG